MRRTLFLGLFVVLPGCAAVEWLMSPVETGVPADSSPIEMLVGLFSPAAAKVVGLGIAAMKGAEAVGTKRGRENLVGMFTAPTKIGKLQHGRALLVGTHTPEPELP